MPATGLCCETVEEFMAIIFVSCRLISRYTRYVSLLRLAALTRKLQSIYRAAMMLYSIRSRLDYPTIILQEIHLPQFR